MGAALMSAYNRPAAPQEDVDDATAADDDDDNDDDNDDDDDDDDDDDFDAVVVVVFVLVVGVVRLATAAEIGHTLVFLTATRRQR
jgi:hypothetical protein